MNKEDIIQKKEELLKIKADLQEEKRYRCTNGIAAVANIAILPFAVLNFFYYGPTSGIFVTSFVVICASANGMFFYKSQKNINNLNQKIVDLENSKDEYNNQKTLTNKTNH